MKYSLIIYRFSIALFVPFLFASCGSHESKDKASNADSIRNKQANEESMAKILKSQSAQEKGEFKTFKNDDQTWMAENLNVSKYRNGDIIPEVRDSSEWSKLTTGAWCYYENKIENGIKYNKLYNWFALNDPRGLAPEGWHIPTAKEWNKLIDKFGGKIEAGGKMKAIDGWSEIGKGTNESGFTGLPGGGRNDAGSFFGGVSGSWWSFTADIPKAGEIAFTVENQTGQTIGLYDDGERVGKLPALGHFGMSVRCVKN